MRIIHSFIFGRFFVLGLVIVGVASARPSDAAPVTFDFSGTLTQISTDPASPFGGDVGLGTPFSGSYTFESTTANAIPGSDSGSYTSPSGAPYGLTMTFSGISGTIDDFLNIGVINGSMDFYTVTACTDSSCSDRSIELTVQDLTGALLSSNALPLDTLVLGPAFGTFALRSTIDGDQVEVDGDVASLTCVSGCVAGVNPAPVPEPGTIVLCTTGLAALWSGARRRAALRVG